MSDLVERIARLIYGDGPDISYVTAKTVIAIVRAESQAEIDRLTRERDGFRESLAVVRVVLDGTTERLESVEEERDAAERKVEKLREAIHSAYVEGWTDATSRDDPKEPGVIDQEWEASLARAAMKETGDD